MKWLPQSLYKPVTCAAHMLLAIKQGDTAEGASSCQALNLPSLLPMICKKMGSLKNAGTYSPPSLQKKDDFLMSINTKVFGFRQGRYKQCWPANSVSKLRTPTSSLSPLPNQAPPGWKQWCSRSWIGSSFRTCKTTTPCSQATLMNSCPYFEHFQPSWCHRIQFNLKPKMLNKN